VLGVPFPDARRAGGQRSRSLIPGARGGPSRTGMRPTYPFRRSRRAGGVLAIPAAHPTEFRGRERRSGMRESDFKLEISDFKGGRLLTSPPTKATYAATTEDSVGLKNQFGVAQATRRAEREQRFKSIRPTLFKSDVSPGRSATRRPERAGRPHHPFFRPAPSQGSEVVAPLARRGRTPIFLPKIFRSKAMV
jgi:hypothetical protein